MPDRAKVTSLEAIENFRAKLIIYRDKAGRVLDEVSDEVIRTRLWLETDRPAFWESQMRRLARELEQRQQELFSAQMSGLREASYMQQVAVQKAKRAIRESEEKMRVARHWRRQFDHQVAPAGRQVEKFRHTVGHEMGMAVTWMNELIKTLAEYTESSSGKTTAAPNPAPGGDVTETEGLPPSRESPR